MKTQLHGATAFYGVGNGEHAPGQPSVVFIHGSGMDHTVWLMPARHFARHGYNVVALDLPGHGGSEGPALTSIDAMSEWVNALLEDLGIGEAAIVGHSMGSLVALDFAARYPTRARSLALLGTSTPMPVSDVLLDAAKNDDRAAMVMANTWSHSAPGLMGGHKSPGMTLYFGGLRLLQRTPEGVYFADLAACNAFEAGPVRAEAVACPTLVVLGNEDKMTGPKQSRAVASSIQGARVVELDCGHAMLSEQSNAVLAALKTIV